MKKVNIIAVLSSLLLVSCFNPSKPNYQYFPNMYESVGYKTYAESGAFRNGIEAQLPAAGSVARGWAPYDYPDTNDGYEAAKANLKSPLAITAEHRAEGKELYNIFCVHCHGEKGDGNGPLVMQEKILGVPSYAPSRLPDITPGSMYHVIMHGKGIMGSHASQLTYDERWKIVRYVVKLRADQE